MHTSIGAALFVLGHTAYNKKHEGVDAHVSHGLQLRLSASVGMQCMPPSWLQALLGAGVHDSMLEVHA